MTMAARSTNVGTPPSPIRPSQGFYGTVIVTGCIALPPVFVHVSVYTLVAACVTERVEPLVIVPMP